MKKILTTVQLSDGRTFGINIAHEPHSGLKGRTTLAEIFRFVDETPQLVSQGQCTCSPQDQFKRHEGVKLALARALAKLTVQGGWQPHLIGTLSRTDRARIWARIWNGKYKPKAGSKRKRKPQLVTA